MQKISFDDLKNKVCVITGGGGVIGSSMALGLATLGVKIVILDLNIEVSNQVVEKIKTETQTEAIAVAANVLNKDSLIQAKKIINEKLGMIDILINCAGGNSPQATTDLEEITEKNSDNISKSFFGLNIEGFQKVFDLNFNGTLLPTMVFTTDMLEQKKGVILNVSSMNAFRPLTKIPAYSAAKSAINNFTEWLAVHLAKMNIRVNAIAPGFFLGEQNRFLLINKETGEPTPRAEKILKNTPMGRFGEFTELQGTVAYLLSDISGFVTGVVIPVDGGFNAYSGV